MAKLRIVGTEGNANGVVVEAQFNPKEIVIEKSIPWQRGKGPSDLKYVGREPRTMSCELLFDGAASGTSIQSEIDKLNTLSDVDIALKHPPKITVVWGPEGGGDLLPRFDAVIETLVVKYTTFDGDGKPLRATADLKFKEARNIMAGKIVSKGWKSR